MRYTMSLYLKKMFCVKGVKTVRGEGVGMAVGIHLFTVIYIIIGCCVKASAHSLNVLLHGNF